MMRFIVMLMAAVSALFFFSCAAAPPPDSMPEPVDEPAPWAEEIREAKKAANKEAEYYIIRVKEQGVRAFDERTPITGLERQWRNKKKAWLDKARKKGFKGSDEEVEPPWVQKWKDPAYVRRRSQ